MECKNMEAEYLISLLFTFTYWQGDYMLLMFFRKRYPAIEQTNYRVIFTAITIIIYTIIAQASIKLVIGNLLEIMEPLTWQGFYDGFYVSTITTIIILLIYETTYFFSQWKKEVLNAEKLKSQQLKMELSVLKNQISPHFLFNSLNTLITLIEENPKVASDFTEKLSEVYRYILQNKEKELVKLSTELHFVESYLFLLKMRFGNNLNFEKNISEDLLEQYIPPLTLQMLVENAIKHNIVSISKPLTIQIYSHKTDTLIVQNTLQKKNFVKDSTQKGLVNIKKRYQFLTRDRVDVITTANYFMVALPLIKVSENQMQPDL
jgi:sensor histidine kinase YesM